MAIRNARGLTAALGLAISSFCAAADSYHLALQIERNGIVVVDTTADVEAGTSADLQTKQADTTTEMRVVSRLTPDQLADDVSVQLQYFEKRNEGWVLLGEPSLIASLGGDAHIEFSADSANHREADRYSIRLRVTSDGVSTMADSGGCTDQEFPMLVSDGTNPKCGSTKAMTCCNVKRCCDNRPGHGDCCDAK